MTEPPLPGLAEATARVAEAWSRRSPGEQAAFANRLAALASTSSLPEDALRIVRERAALSGALAPADLVRGIGRERAAQVLDVLASNFDRMLLPDGRWAWMLRAESRQNTLARLTATGQLTTALGQVADIGTDPAGEALRALAATRTLPEADSATKAQALAWAQPLGGFAGDLAEVQRHAAIEWLYASYEVLVRYGVFGRELELTRLRAFAEEQPNRSRPIPLLPVIGMGGVGKSTLLGTFIQPYLDRIAAGDPTCPAVVVIDFDRLLFRPDAELELSFELTRQLGLAAPIAAADFSALRYQVQTEQQQSGSEGFTSGSRAESSSRQATGFESEIGVLVRMHELQGRPVLLVLDTFEEWQRERPDPETPWSTYDVPEMQILNWIFRVRTDMSLDGLRVVVCGRADLTDVDSTGMGVETREALLLGDLPTWAARRLLEAVGVDAGDTEKLVALVGHNPLTLHVAARFYLELPAAARRDFLAGDPLSADGLTGDLRRAVLYDRFLEHIADREVRKLAHPGLVLRRVTPDLVQHVLAEPCGLGQIDREKATRLTNRLANEVWLVRETPDGLHHRSDVRGPMLRLMRDDPAYSDVARQIHAGAVQWYTNGRDPTLSTEAAGREAFYHSLMLETGEESLLGRTPVGPSGLKDQRWMRLAQELGEAVDELPPKVAAQVRVLRGDRIEDRDATLLPEPIWQQWAARHGLELVGAGQAAAALALFDARQAVRPVRAEPEWLAQAYSDTARWGEYWHTVREIDVLAPFPDRTKLGSGRYALLNAFLSPLIDDFFDYERALREYFELRDTDSAPAAAFERLFLHLLCTFAIPVGRLYRPQRRWEAPPVAAEMLTQSGRRGREQGVIDIYPVDQLRRVMVWIGARSGAPTFGIEQPAALFRPDPQWMRDFAWFVGADPGMVNAYFRSLEGAADELRSHDLLGEWSLSYSRRLGPSEVIVLERSHIRRVARSMAVLRGDNPEFRPAIVLALQSVVSGQDDMGELGRIAWPLLPIQPADLDPSAIQRTGQRALIQLVEYVDRSGVMGEFLAGVRDARPGSALIGEVSRAFARWDAVHRQLLNVLAEDVLRP